MGHNIIIAFSFFLQITNHLFLQEWRLSPVSTIPYNSYETSSMGEKKRFPETLASCRPILPTEANKFSIMNPALFDKCFDILFKY